MDWADLFGFSVSPLEMIVRGSAMYWFLFVLFRFVLHRDAGSIAIADVLLLVLIADAAQNAMAGGYETVAEGWLLVATIAGWSFLLDWLVYKFPQLQRFAEAKPLELVRDGCMLRRNMSRELVTADELHAKLREQGIEDLAQVKRMFMEGNGEISVIRYDKAPPPDAGRGRVLP